MCTQLPLSLVSSPSSLTCCPVMFLRVMSSAFCNTRMSLQNPRGRVRDFTSACQPSPPLKAGAETALSNPSLLLQPCNLILSLLLCWDGEKKSPAAEARAEPHPPHHPAPRGRPISHAFYTGVVFLLCHRFPPNHRGRLPRAGARLRGSAGRVESSAERPLPARGTAAPGSV